MKAWRAEFWVVWVVNGGFHILFASLYSSFLNKEKFYFNIYTKFPLQEFKVLTTIVGQMHYTHEAGAAYAQYSHSTHGHGEQCCYGHWFLRKWGLEHHMSDKESGSQFRFFETLWFRVVWSDVIFSVNAIEAQVHSQTSEICK